MRHLALCLLLLGCGETHTGDVEYFSYRPGYYTTTIVHVGKSFYPQQHWHQPVCYVRMTDGWECSATGECSGIEFGRRVTMTCTEP